MVTGYNHRPIHINRQNECHKPSHSSSSSFLQEFANGPNTSPAEGGPKLRDKSKSLARHQGGVDLVGHTDDKMEWQDGNTLGTRPDYRIGRLNAGLGSLASRYQHRGTVVSSGETVAHKLPGIASGDSSTEDLPQKQSRSIRSVEDRQHNSGCLYQQSRGDGVQRIDSPNERPLDVVPGEEHPHSSLTPTRGDEPGGRQGVENHKGQIRLESGQSILSPDQQTLWATRSGPIHVSTDQSVPPLLQLATRSLCRGNRCVSPGLDGSERVWEPSMEFDPKSANKSAGSKSRCYTGGSGMEDGIHFSFRCW